MHMYNIHSILTDGFERFKGHKYIFERKCDVFSGRTYDSFAKDVWGFASFLLSKDMLDKNIIIYGENSYNYMVADVAVMGYVGTSCTISKEWTERELENAIKLLEAEAVIYSRNKQDAINAVSKTYPDIKYIVLEDISDFIDYDNAVLNRRDTDICCKVIFSSGTTGMPKAVMLSQKNMFACWENLKKRTPFTKDDRDYLFLPLSHTYGGICNFLYSMITGMSIYICSDTKLITQELQLVKPSVFCAVPLIFEKIYSACTQNNIPPCVMLGSNIKYLFSGGAHLKPEIRSFFKNAGINLLEAYGLTETSSLVSCEYTNSEDFESVGAIMENVQVCIDSPDKDGIGEITVCGENIFSGYYKNDIATKNAFDRNGFFRTQDIGFIKDNRLYVLGRKTRTIVLSNGENIAPDEIEKLICEYRQINRAKVFENNGRLCATLFAAEKINADVLILKVNERLPKYSRIYSYDVVCDSIETRLK